MAMTAGPSKYAMKMNYIYIALCVGFTIYMIYDGYFNQKFIDKYTKEDGSPKITLTINKSWGPIGCAAGAIWFGIATYSLSRRKLVVDEKGLTFEDGTFIPLDSLTKIDKSKFKKSGKILIDYEVDGETKTFKLRDSIYDDIKGILDEILVLTGKGDKQETNELENTDTQDDSKPNS